MTNRYELRRMRRTSTRRSRYEYRLHDGEGRCALTAEIGRYPRLPKTVTILRDNALAGRLERRGVLGRELHLVDRDQADLLCLRLPVLTSALRTTPFDLTEPTGIPVLRLVPTSALEDHGGTVRSALNTLLDSELVLMADREVIGHTSGGTPNPARESGGGARSLVGLPRRLAQWAFAEAGYRRGEEQGGLGMLHMHAAHPLMTTELAFLILLFRHFDYRDLRDIS